MGWAHSLKESLVSRGPIVLSFPRSPLRMRDKSDGPDIPRGHLHSFQPTPMLPLGFVQNRSHSKPAFTVSSRLWKSALDLQRHRVSRPSSPAVSFDAAPTCKPDKLHHTTRYRVCLEPVDGGIRPPSKNRLRALQLAHSRYDISYIF